MYKRSYSFRMNIMEEIIEIRSCIDILANDIKVYVQVDHCINRVSPNLTSTH